MTATCLSASAHADDIKVVASGAIKLALEQLIPVFEQSSGHTVKVLYGPAGAIAKRVESGDPADVAIVTRAQLDSLVTQGKIVAGSGVGFASATIGVAIRKGAPRPDISTVDAFKRTLLAARFIGYRDPNTGSTSGTYTARMIEKLGIAAELQPRTKLDNSDGEHPENVFQALVGNETDLQIGSTTEIAIAPGVELLGPLPAEIQQVTLLTAGIAATSTATEAARAFIGFLAGATAAVTLKANGFQPASGP
jgi:molybdate transport system substrate-binding protein